MPHCTSSRSHTSMLRTLALFLATTTMCIPAAGVAAEGYNINAGEEWSQAPAQSSGKPRSRFTDFSQTRPATSLADTPQPAPNDVGLPALTPITLTPPSSMRQRMPNARQRVQLTDTSVPSGAQGHYIEPASDVMMPSQPLYPSRSGDAAAPALAAPAPVSAVAAPTVISEPAPTSASSGQGGMPAYQALTSSNAVTSAPPASAAMATTSLPDRPEFAPPAALRGKTAPVAVATIDTSAASGHVVELPPPPPLQDAQATTPQTHVPSAPAIHGGTEIVAASTPVSSPPLSDESKRILDNVRPASQTPIEQAKRVKIGRVSPEVIDIVKKAEEVYESAGVSIRVSSAQLDVTTELERAYEALMAGNNEIAIRIYQEILQRNPSNEEALFGLAASYHRSGQIENARPLYGRLLAQNPNHREALNNFLMLVANESPRDALQELAKLEARNPAYSPIPAQMAILYDRLGEPEIARSKMLRAIEISPENWVYKYNLAIMLDRQGAYADAAAIYRELIKASLQGEKMPMDMKALQARLNYIASRT